MSKPLILVADDHADVRQALALLLRDCGYDVLTAASPGEALSALRQSPPDLILLDLNYQRDTTSGAEGLELLKQIRAQHRELPVVVLTGWATVSLAVGAMHLGAQDFLEKPWENARVRSLVAQHLAAARARAEVHRLEDAEQLSDGEADAPIHTRVPCRRCWRSPVASPHPTCRFCSRVRAVPARVWSRAGFTGTHRAPGDLSSV